MFRTKREVDSHVRDLLAKVTSESDKVQKCLVVAKLYAAIKEFDSAKRYLETYLQSPKGTPNRAEAQKLLGDIHLELSEEEKALEAYKLAYDVGKGRDALNRVCDLLAQGCGAGDSPQSRNSWLELQKSAGPAENVPKKQNGLSRGQFSTAAFITQRGLGPSPGGPPRSGMNGNLVSMSSSSPTFRNSTSTPVKGLTTTQGISRGADHFTPKARGNGTGPRYEQSPERLYQQIHYLERRYEDVMDKFVEQNGQVLDAVQSMKDELASQIRNDHVINEIHLIKSELLDKIKFIQEKVDQLSLTQEQMLKDREKYVYVAAPQQPVFQSQPEVKKNQNQNQVAPVPAPQPQPQVVPTTTTMFAPAPQAQPPNTYAFGASKPAPPVTTSSTLSFVPNPYLNINPPTTAATTTTSFASGNTGFSFSLSSGSGNSSQTETAKAKTSTPKSDPSTTNLFANLNLTSSSPGFGELANTTPPTGGFSKPADFKGFGTGRQLFANVPDNPSPGAAASGPSPRNRSNSEGEDDFVPTAEFTPVIPLPPLIEVKTGVEDENVIFEHRAKIYRFDSEKKEWKERGLGNIKILQNKDDISVVRVLMWRERVLKLACNHRITGDMKVEFYQNNPKIVKWLAIDHSEEEGATPEIFTCRFGTEEKCAEFKARMEEMIEIVARSPTKPSQVLSSPSSSPVTSQESKTQSTTEASKPLSELFKKKEGSWDCNVCYVNNGKEASKCVSCETPQPGFESQVAAEKEKADKEAAAQTPAFSFGFNASTTNSFASGNSGFSFNLPTGNQQQPQPAAPAAAPTITPKPDLSSSNLFANLSFASPGFGDLAKTTPTTGGFSKPADFKGFGQGKQLFADVPDSRTPSATAPANNNASANNTPPARARTASEGEDDFVPTAEFAPVIPLPPLVEVKTGVEDENVVYEHRAKIYRFDREKKEWKERGVGNIKILQNKDDASIVRVLMWRERVLKLACNHRVTGDMKVEYYQNNPKVVKWLAIDHSEEEGATPEIFTCRFGTEEACADFKTKMEEMIQVVATSPTKSPQVLSSPESNSNPSPSQSQDAAKPLSELFKKPEGSWECQICYVNNGKDAIKCVSCETPQPGFESQVEAEKEEADKAAATQLPKFSFGFNSYLGTDSSNSSSGGLFGSGFSFNLPTGDKQQQSAASTTTDSPNLFANLSLSSSGFGDLAKTTPPTGGFSKPADFKGFDTGKPLFGDVPTNPSPGAATTTAATPRNRSNSEGEDDFVPTAEFAPVIPLPPLVEVKTGVEDENVIFEHRAKIYRFDSERKEWKERGVGNIKILQNKDDVSVVRVLMWRERVLKLACNHRVTGDMKVEYYQNNPKVVKWLAIDHSEEEGATPEIFTCRFGTEEKCAEFKTKMEEMIQVVAESPSKPSQVLSSPSQAQEAKVTNTENPASAKPLSELFKKAEGSWECQICYVNNGKEAIKCVSCETPQPGFEAQVADEKEQADKEAAAQAPAFSFGFNSFGQDSSKSTLFGSGAGGIGGFSFNTAPTTGAGDKQQDSTPKTDSSNLFANLSFASPGFGELAKTTPTTGGFSKPADFKGFEQGKTLFGDVPVKPSPAAAGDSASPRTRRDSEGEDDFVPTAEFAPVIPLPPLVEVKTGVEDENLIFEHRAKIYRFDSVKKEWKERGVGNIKILQNKDDISIVRVLMWRERVLKLACNHRINGDMKIDYYQNNKKVLTWSAIDHSEEETSPEIFTCRFGTEEKCAEFKAKMEEMIQIVANAPVKSSPGKVLSSPLPTNEATNPPPQGAAQPLSELFKKPEGSWECQICYVSNGKEAIKCVSCETPQPGFESQVAAEKEEADKKAAAQIPAFSFGFNFKSPVKGDISSTNIFGGSPAAAPSFSFSLPTMTDNNSKLVEAVSEPEDTPNQSIELSSDLKERAAELQLPEDFYNFETEGACCSGCVGCDPDAFDFSKPEEKLESLDPASLADILGTREAEEVINAAWSAEEEEG